MIAIELAKGRFWWWDVRRLNRDGTWTWIDSGWHLTYNGAVRAASKVE
jgi:hypothetical protein